MHDAVEVLARAGIVQIDDLGQPAQFPSLLRSRPAPKEWTPRQFQEVVQALVQAGNVSLRSLQDDREEAHSDQATAMDTLYKDQTAQRMQRAVFTLCQAVLVVQVNLDWSRSLLSMAALEPAFCHVQADNSKTNDVLQSGKKGRKQQREQVEVAWLQPKLAGLQALQHWATKLAAHELPAACCNMQQVRDQRTSTSQLWQQGDSTQGGEPSQTIEPLDAETGIDHSLLCRSCSSLRQMWLSNCARRQAEAAGPFLRRSKQQQQVCSGADGARSVCHDVQFCHVCLNMVAFD